MILGYKLITGEEIVGKLIEDGEDYFVLDKVFLIEEAPSEVGIGYTLTPYMLSNHEAELEFNYSDIITSVEVHKEISNTYLKETMGVDFAAQFGDIK